MKNLLFINFLTLVCTFGVANARTVQTSQRSTIAELSTHDKILWQDRFVPDVPITFGTRMMLMGMSVGKQEYSLLSPKDLMVISQNKSPGCEVTPQNVHGCRFDYDNMLYTDMSPGPIILQFKNPVRAVGTDIQSNDFYNRGYVVSMTVHYADGSKKLFKTSGNPNRTGNEVAPFIGAVSDQADIVKVEFKIAQLAAYTQPYFSQTHPGFSLPVENGNFDLAINIIELAY